MRDTVKKSCLGIPYSNMYTNKSQMVWFVILLCKHQSNLSKHQYCEGGGINSDQGGRGFLVFKYNDMTK